MSDESQQVAGILLIVVPTIEYGGYSLLRFLTKRTPGYLDNPVRRALFTAGHAHAGVLVLLALVGLLYVDGANLSPGAKLLVRNSLALAPILVSAGFFVDRVASRDPRRAPHHPRPPRGGVAGGRDDHPRHRPPEVTASSASRGGASRTEDAHRTGYRPIWLSVCSSAACSASENLPVSVSCTARAWISVAQSMSAVPVSVSRKAGA